MDSKDEIFLMTVSYGDHNCLQEVLRTQPNINTQDAVGNSALTLALFYNHFDCAQALLEHGIRPDLQNTYGDTALIYAVQKRKPLSVIRMLLSYHQNINLKNMRGATALMLAVALNESSYVDLLLQHAPNLNAQNKKGLSALMIAAQKNDLASLELLLEHGANPSLSNKAGQTALCYAIENNNTQAAALLQRYGAELITPPPPMLFFSRPNTPALSHYSRLTY